MLRAPWCRLSPGAPTEAGEWRPGPGPGTCPGAERSLQLLRSLGIAHWASRVQSERCPGHQSCGHAPYLHLHPPKPFLYVLGQSFAKGHCVPLLQRAGLSSFLPVRRFEMIDTIRPAGSKAQRSAWAGLH